MYAGDRKLEKKTIDIETAGATAEVKMHGATTLSLSVRGDAAADYAIDARLDENDSWTQGVGATYSGAADYDDTDELGWPEVRIRCTSGTATAGDSATVKLAAGGG